MDEAGDKSYLERCQVGANRRLWWAGMIARGSEVIGGYGGIGR